MRDDDADLGTDISGPGAYAGPDGLVIIEPGVNAAVCATWLPLLTGAISQTPKRKAGLIVCRLLVERACLPPKPAAHVAGHYSTPICHKLANDATERRKRGERVS